jgi:hypothetical protein
MQRKILAAAIFALFALFGISPSFAQSTSVVVLPGGCGTGSAGSPSLAYLTVDSTLKLCVNGSGGAVTIANGADVALGSTTDPVATVPTSGTAATAISLLKSLNNTVSNPIPGGTNVIGGVTGSYFYNVASSVLTRASNTTTYTANTTWCLLASTTACAPITIAIGGTNAGKGILNRINLLKSGVTTANANFTIWLFSAAPTVTTPAQYDNVAYTGPRAADMPNYIGSATCTSPVVTSDSTVSVWYECALSNPNTGGALEFQTLSGSTSINALISVTAAYVPVSAETLTVYASGIY